MKKLLLYLFVISTNLITKGQNVIDQFNNINNERKASEFISDYRDIIPQRHYRNIDSQYDSTRQDLILLSLKTGDTVTLGKYLNKIVQSRQYTSCFAESFRLKCSFADTLLADSILRVIQTRLGKGELFSDIARDYSIDMENAYLREYRLHNNEENEFIRTILQIDSGEVCLVPYTIGNFYYVFKKTSANFEGKISKAFRLYKSDYCELLPVKTTIYRYYNAKNELKHVFKKEVSGNSIIYTRYTFPDYTISREILTIQDADKLYYNPDDIWQSTYGSDEREIETITYEFFKCNETSKIRTSRSPKRFIKRNAPLRILFHRYDMLVFSLRNDTLIREEINATYYSPHSQIFQYCDTLVNIYDYSLKKDTISGKLEYWVNFSDSAKLMHYCLIYLHNVNGYSFKPDSLTEIFYNDSIKFSEIKYHYNNEPQWIRLLCAIRIEGPDYINIIHEMDTKLFSRIYSYKSGKIYTTELKKDKKGRIIEIIFKTNGEIYKRCEIEYKQ